MNNGQLSAHIALLEVKGGQYNPLLGCNLTRLLLSCEDNSKSRLAAHHVLVSFTHALQRKDFRHSPHAGQHTEGERILRIYRSARVPTQDRTASCDEQKCGHFE